MINILDSTYLIVPEKIAQDKRLKSFEKVLFGKIYGLSKGEGYCWASNSYLAKYFDVSKSCVSRGIKTLSNLGYIKLKYDKKEKNNSKKTIYINYSGIG